MANFVLVHGSFHGPWCWSHIVPLLEARGHSAIAPDLADAKNNPDLHDYATLVVDTIVKIGGPVILVGHSMGGLVITQVAELVPEHLSALVYVSGLLLRNGETLQTFLDAHAYLDVDDLVLKNMKLSENGKLASFPAEAAPSVFYNRCTGDDAGRAVARLRAQPTAVYTTPLAISPQKFGAVPRYYAECTDDRAVSIKYQRQMLANTPCKKIYNLDADHSPFLSDIDGLMTCLLDVTSCIK
jgi:pimeloyl-ACP methyl ester carboxylesterase